MRYVVHNDDDVSAARFVRNSGRGYLLLSCYKLVQKEHALDSIRFCRNGNGSLGVKPEYSWVTV